ncbi:M13 family metallopeptidase [soil metagenome]
MKRLLLAAAGAALLAGLPLQAQTPSYEALQASFAPWGIDFSAFDKSVRPGDDFDSYVSGAWRARTEIPADRSRAGLDLEIDEMAKVQLRDIIDTAPPKSLIGGLYRSFMDEARLESLDAKPLQRELRALAAVKDKRAMARVLGATSAGFGSSIIALYVGSDPDQPGRHVLYVVQDGLGLPDRNYYLDAKFATQLAAYRAYLERSFALVNDAAPAANADRVLAFETAIAQVSWTRADRRNIDKTHNPMSLKDLQAYAPGFPWRELLDGALIKGDPGTLIVRENSAIQALAKLFAETPLETLKAWEAAHVIDTASPYLSKRFVDSKFEFTRVNSGATTNEPRWKRGSTLIDSSLGEALGIEYVKRYFPASSKQEMERLVGFLKQSMAEHLRGLDWMDVSTRQQAQAKLDSMLVMVGYPDKWRDYSRLRIDPADLFGNLQRSTRFDWDKQVADLKKPVDRTEWGMTPQTNNAYNGFFLNEIVFPAGILQPPYYNPKADAAVNYGAIGATIGHEISHGFDDQGRKIDSTGLLRDWWTAQDAARFKAQAAVLGQQFGSYEPLPGMHLDGDLTMGENIADLAGLEVALDAYHRSLGGAPAPVIDGLTGDQRFFLSYAQSWRTKTRPDRLRLQIASDPHSPANFRVNGIVRNMDAWYQAFDVKPGDALYLAPEKRVHIW